VKKEKKKGKLLVAAVTKEKNGRWKNPEKSERKARGNPLRNSPNINVQKKNQKLGNQKKKSKNKDRQGKYQPREPNEVCREIYIKARGGKDIGSGGGRLLTGFL